MFFPFLKGGNRMLSIRMRYTWLAIVLAGVMAIVLACGGADDEADAAPAAAAQPTPVPAMAAPPDVTVSEHVRMAQGAEPNSMYSRDRASLQNVLFQKNIWDPLVEIIDDELSGRLATAWETNSDFTKWTWTLREGVTFHNGDPFNAEAAKKAVEHVRSAEPALRGTPYYKDTIDVVVEGEYTLSWTLNTPHPIQPFEETNFFNGIEHVDLLNEVGLGNFRLRPVGGGTGAYKFVDWVELEKVELEANRDWFGPQAAVMPEKATVFAIPDPATRLAALLNNEIDWLVNPLIPQVETISNSPEHRIMSEGQFDVQVYYVNPGRVAALHDRRLRQAISEAIDRETVLNDVLGGFGSLLHGNVPTTSIIYDENAPPFPNFDLENAKRLVAELKAEGVYNDEPIEFLAPRGVYNEDVRQNQVVADMVSKAGINAVAFIADDAIREEKTSAGACDWDYQFRLPVDTHGDPEGWHWRSVNPEVTTVRWCGWEETSPGVWEDEYINEWIALGNEAKVLPVGEARNAKWIEAYGALNKSHAVLGLYQLNFVYGVSNEWDWKVEKREAAYIWLFKKR
jgi:ABC-type transport system substrate-binding protein